MYSNTSMEIASEMETRGVTVSQLEIRTWIMDQSGPGFYPGPAPKWTSEPPDHQLFGLDKAKFAEMIEEFNEITVKEFHQDYGNADCHLHLMHIGIMATSFAIIYLIAFTFNGFSFWFGTLVCIVSLVINLQLAGVANNRAILIYFLSRF